MSQCRLRSRWRLWGSSSRRARWAGGAGAGQEAGEKVWAGTVRVGTVDGGCGCGAAQQGGQGDLSTEGCFHLARPGEGWHCLVLLLAASSSRRARWAGGEGRAGQGRKGRARCRLLLLVTAVGAKMGGACTLANCNGFSRQPPAPQPTPRLPPAPAPARTQVRHWGLSNESTFGVCKLCEAAAKLGVPPPISIQNDFR